SPRPSPPKEEREKAPQTPPLLLWRRGPGRGGLLDAESPLPIFRSSCAIPPLASLPHEPLPRSLLSLAWRACLRRLLCPVPRRKKMGLGSLLARRRILLLDYLPMAACLAADPGPVGGSSAAVLEHAWLDIFLRRDVGPGRTYLRADDAVSWHVPRHG